MNLEMVFNELSLQTQAPNIYVAREWMSTFIKTLVLATSKYSIKRILRIEAEFFNHNIASNYTITLWCNDSLVDREEKRFFRLLQTKYPALIDFEKTEIEDQYYSFNFRYNNKIADGLGVAYLLDALAVSIQSSEQWNTNRLTIELNPRKSAIVYHASHPKHLQQNTNWIQKQLTKDDPWLKNNLPKLGQYPYKPPKSYYLQKSYQFPTKVHQNSKAFIDYKAQLWIWDKEEKHWDVQFKPYGRGNYLRVTSDGRLLNE